MRGAIGLLLFATVWLGVTSALWLRETNDEAIPNDPATTLSRFEQSHPSTQIAIHELYAGRLELLDPRLALPTWHQHAHDEAVRVHIATSTCPPRPTPPIGDPILAKAYEWHALTCNGKPFDGAIDQPPYLHPSGRSYASLAARGRSGPWLTDHARLFHVAELPSLDAALLPLEQRALARLSFETWEVLTRGDLIAVTSDALVIAERDALGLSKLRLYALADWNSFARRAGIALSARKGMATCQRPASPELCWTSLSPAQRHRNVLLASGGLSFLVLVGSALAIAALWMRERNRLAQDRIEALRILTHELRTPATTLRIDIEPLRAAYDDLPRASQEPVLRISDGVERLHRVIHRSARYLALLETPDAPRERLLRLEEHPSIAELLAALAEEWPTEPEVTIVDRSPDRAVRTDPDWLGLVLRNLVENAVRHGRPPVTVTWSTDGDDLVLRVGDHGSTPGFSLRNVAPFQRAKDSGGLGLGLALILRGTSLLGGRLSHEPSPTVFELRVPLSGVS